MGYAVLHHEKGKDSGANHGNHVDRNERGKNSFKHANPELRGLNVTYRLKNDRHLMPLSEAIKDRIKEGYKGKRKIRNDAVKYLKTVLTGSHEDMKEIFKDGEKAKEWIRANGKFIENEFGKENIVRFTLHMDEKTPHIHVVTVPLTEDGRLSAKEVIGNKDKLKERQDRYAKAMKSFGLKRGVENTGIKHEDAKAYYGRIKRVENSNGFESLVQSHWLKGKTKESYKKALEDVYKALEDEKQQQEIKERSLKAMRELEDWRENKKEEKIKKLTKKVNKQDSVIYELLTNDEKRKELKNKLELLEKQDRDKEEQREIKPERRGFRR